jgi:hypothetical protein
MGVMGMTGVMGTNGIGGENAKSRVRGDTNSCKGQDRTRVDHLRAGGRNAPGQRGLSLLTSAATKEGATVVRGGGERDARAPIGGDALMEGSM